MFKFIFLLLLFTQNQAFQAPNTVTGLAVTKLLAKKSTSGQGFGKVPTPTASSPGRNDSDQLNSEFKGLQDIEGGSSNEMSASVQQNNPSIDPNLPVEQRTNQILREQYGLRTLEDQRREEAKMLQREKVEKLKAAAEKDDFDIMSVIPPPLLIAIDRFLKAGLAITTLLFVAAGGAITAEAWSKASKNPLPDDIDKFIVNTVEPNFTPGLFLLLGFSVSLGIFAALQLGSSGSQYSED
mmetsp:Transcript_29931/g.45351  ORF Transcript_29931/g.45351 Transcript_29931/m.45351 type:complete len:239 (-) Transcript_29931:47-763(-)|eukprot:CAMPEP_0178919802 /NCGR_PEP_ID=MMETSP0786-20121207/14643_1 /TAXON_ID=186022 /ORGANISM="Thalassionema frauenfeldii, Strain CCMP 1798" /LENGTH=238 /DNA_ID=CAMNT_0020593781 /DNA_START=163 /DNA_END=879 /DNA_ORIENTATION=+